jgi:hypothetical protein
MACSIATLPLILIGLAALCVALQRKARAGPGRKGVHRTVVPLAIWKQESAVLRFSALR